jgi:hypothetical protein
VTLRHLLFFARTSPPAPAWSAAVHAYDHGASYVSGVYLAATTYVTRANMGHSVY